MGNFFKKIIKSGQNTDKSSNIFSGHDVSIKVPTETPAGGFPILPFVPIVPVSQNETNTLNSVTLENFKMYR